MDKTKRLREQLEEFNAANKNIKFTFGTLVVTAWCVFLIVIATFTRIDFSHYMLGLHGLSTGSFVKVLSYSYVPQVPVIFFIAALIGNRFGILSVLIYITLGLTLFPIFALGGGLNYVFQYNFGYILAYIPAIYIVSFMLKDKFSYGNIAKATLLGVLTIHIIGVFYLILMAIIHHDSFANVTSWMFMQSGMKLIYDFIFGFLALWISKPVKHILWLSMS